VFLQIVINKSWLVASHFIIPLLSTASFEDYVLVLVEPNGALGRMFRKILPSTAGFTCYPFNPFVAEQRIKKKSANM
jgi:hypothetical protein